jgi:phosphoribosylaminoimidazole (AIR) synthetase
MAADRFDVAGFSGGIGDGDVIVAVARIAAGDFRLEIAVGGTRDSVATS